MDDLALIKSAIEGNKESRQSINKIAESMIAIQSSTFCKRFCRDNRFHYQCSLLSSAWRVPYEGAAFCEWGNASYGWMLEYLTNEKRLQKFEGKNGAKLKAYFFVIANSLPFYEHWKNWRFDRRIHVPTYIQDIAKEASRVFWALCSHQEVPTIAAKLKLSEDEVFEIVDKIVLTLTRRNKLNLLNQPKIISIDSGNEPTGEDSDEYVGIEIPDESMTPDRKVLDQQIQKVFKQLLPIEQFVIEQMVYDENKAKEVLETLKHLDISLKEGLSPKDMNIQHVYFFYRKTLDKLKKLLE